MCTILWIHLGVLGAARPPTVFYFSSKNGSSNQNETFSIVFLTKFLTNSWNEIFIGSFFFDLWMFKTLRGPHGPRLGGWRLIGSRDDDLKKPCIHLLRWTGRHKIIFGLGSWFLELFSALFLREFSTVFHQFAMFFALFFYEIALFCHQLLYLINKMWGWKA